MSKKTQMYTQCTMEREVESSSGRKATIQHVAWIPSTLANPGKSIKIKNSNDDWIEWVVRSAGSAMKAEEAEENATAYKRQRRASDQIRHRNADGSSSTTLPTKR